MQMIDMHCDTVWGLTEKEKAGISESLTENTLAVDVKGMRKAGSMAQFFACFIYMKMFEGEKRWEEGFQYAKRMLKRLKKEIMQSTDMEFAYRTEDVRKNFAGGKISAVMTIEEGGILDNRIERLDEFYKEGVRLVTLLWNEENCIGYPNSKDVTLMQKGLKPFGIECIRKMNELGMLIDVSHMSDGGFWDVVRYSSKPFVASHSNARAICAHPRNLSDKMLKAIGESGSVAGMNLYPYFVNKEGVSTYEALARHVLHMVDKAGIEGVAIGTDLDGFDEGETPIMKIGDMTEFYRYLQKKGMRESDLRKIWYENVLRVLL